VSDTKTKATKYDVTEFICSVENSQRRHDAEKILTLFAEITGQDPVMWGSSIIGYGEYEYTLANGKNNTFMRTGFSPRKQNMALYIMPGFEKIQNVMNDLGKFKTGKSCLYINKLSDVNEEVLKTVIEESLREMQRLYPI
jgi:hypothetical protein